MLSSLEIAVRKERAMKRGVCVTIETLLNHSHISRQMESGYRVSYNQEKEIVVIKHDNFEKVLEINVNMDSVTSFINDILYRIDEHKLLEREDYFFE